MVRTACSMVVVALVLAGASGAAGATEPGPARVAAERFEAAFAPASPLDTRALVAHAERRAPRQDRLSVVPEACRGHAWPALPLRCLFAADGIDRSERRAVRTITIEERTGPTTSTLVRVPATLAQR